MTRLLAFLLLAAFACSTPSPTVLELTIRKPDGTVTATDVVRLERRMLALRGVTLVSVSAGRNTLIIHHEKDIELEQIGAVLAESGIEWTAVTD